MKNNLIMNKVKNDIFTKQNEPRNIARLAAQRYLYSKGKSMDTWFLLISTLVPFGLLLTEHYRILPHNGREMVAYTVALMLTLYSVVNYFLVRNKSRIAASIQERFDNDVFGLAPGKYSEKKEVDEEFILRTSVKLEKQGDLKDWYSDYSDEERDVAVLKCQQENLFWDGAQRNRYTGFLLVALALIVLVYLLLLLALDLAVNALIFLPFTGLALYVICFLGNNIYIHKELRAKYFDLKYQLQFGEGIQNDIQREIQDFIYSFRRKGALIPDWFYQWFKTGIQSKIYQFDSGNGQIKIETREWSFLPKRKLHKAAKSFDEAFSSVDELSQSMVKRLESSNAQEVTLEMGVKVSGDIGAYIAKASGEGQMKVTVRWSNGNKISN
jgi:hypothetical protein